MLLVNDNNVVCKKYKLYYVISLIKTFFFVTPPMKPIIVLLGQFYLFSALYLYAHTIAKDFRFYHKQKQYKKSTVMDLESLRTAELKEAFDEFDKVTILTLKSVPKI